MIEKEIEMNERAGMGSFYASPALTHFSQHAHNSCQMGIFQIEYNYV